MPALAPDSPGEPFLAARLSLKHLKDEAKARLKALRQDEPQAKLADVQFQLARELGFGSWRALKAEVDRRRGEATPSAKNKFCRYVGAYRYDPAAISNGILELAEHDGRLCIETSEGAKLELLEQENGVFSQPGMTRRLEFIGDETWAAAALIIRNERGSVRLERISAEAAREAKRAIAAALAEQARPRLAIRVTSEIIARYLGHYSTRLGPAIEITGERDRLFARVTGQQRMEVFPETEARFFYTVVPAQLSFVVEGRNAVALVLHQNGQETRLARVSPEVAERAGEIIQKKANEQLRPRTAVPIDPGVLAGYVGRYILDPTRTMTVTREAGRLFIEVTGQERREVYPESERDFFWTAVAAQITFVTDERGRASSAIVHQGGRDLPLARLETAAVVGPADVYQSGQGA
jgi:hypothetical protein